MVVMMRLLLLVLLLAAISDNTAIAGEGFSDAFLMHMEIQRQMDAEMAEEERPSAGFLKTLERVRMRDPERMVSEKAAAWPNGMACFMVSVFSYDSDQMAMVMPEPGARSFPLGMLTLIGGGLAGDGSLCPREWSWNWDLDLEDGTHRNIFLAGPPNEEEE